MSVKLQQIEISAFGGLSHVTLSLAEGCNLICAPNGSGKSSLCAFLHFAFYGLPRGRRERDRAERMACLPWGGGPARGAVTFWKDGVSYRLERSFDGEREQLRLCYAATGEEIPIAGGDVGPFAFGMDEETFSRTLFVGQESLAVTESGALETRIRNAVTSGDERVSYESACRALEDAMRPLSYKNRAGGRIEDLSRQLASLRARREACIAEYDEYIAAEESLREIDALREELDRRSEELARRLGAAESADPAASDEERAARLAELRDRLTDREGAPIGEEDINRLSELSHRKRSSRTTVLRIAGGLMLAAGLGAGVLLRGSLNILTILPAAVGAAIGAFLLLSTGRDAGREEQRELCARLGCAPDGAAAYAEHLRRLLAEQERLRGMEEKQETAAAPGRSKEQSVLREELAACQAKRAELTQDRDALRAVRQRFLEKGETPTSLLDRMNEVGNELVALQNEAESIRLAEQWLSQAFQHLQTTLAPALSSRAGGLLARMSGSRYTGLAVDHRCGVSLQKDGALRPLSRFSAGERDMTYLALRLALAELLGGEERPPLILDDCFARLDDECLAMTLPTLCFGGQTLLLTCHDREREILRAAGIPCALPDFPAPSHENEG